MTKNPIIVVGGVSSVPRNYHAFVEVLHTLSGSEVYVAPLTPLDWVTGYFRGFGQLVFEIATTVDRALLESDSDKAILIGHSAGGVAARVYIGGDAPYGGRRYSGHRRVSHLITLGSPHAVRQSKTLASINRVNELFPGALHGDSGLVYRSVAGNAVDGSSSRKARKRYERMAGDGRAAGDGVTPVKTAHLPGSEGVVLDGVYHNRRVGHWYGADRDTIIKWWPEELALQEALVEKHDA
jgi:pimeloyl-ACP methyl ester carboxylesterase